MSPRLKKWCLHLSPRVSHQIAPMIYAPCLAFRVHVAGDQNKTTSFVVGVLSTSIARALLGLILLESELPMQLSI